MSKILFLMRKKKFISSSHRIIPFYYIDKSIAHHFSPTVCINNFEKVEYEVINILTSEGMENTPLRSHMNFVSGVFSTCVYTIKVTNSPG